jgi:hypothetical protein
MKSPTTDRGVGALLRLEKWQLDALRAQTVQCGALLRERELASSQLQQEWSSTLSFQRDVQSDVGSYQVDALRRVARYAGWQLTQCEQAKVLVKQATKELEAVLAEARIRLQRRRLFERVLAEREREAAMNASARERNAIEDLLVLRATEASRATTSKWEESESWP